MAENDFRDQLGRIRQRIQQKQDSATQLTELFEERREELDKRRKGLRKFSAAVRELEKDKRVIGAVSAHFDIIPQEQIDRVEETYPLTASSLFSVSEKVIKGVFGPRLQASGQSLSEDILCWESLITLLILYVCKPESRDKNTIPEILEAIEDHPVISEVKLLVTEMNYIDFEKIVFSDHKKSGPGHKYCRSRIDDLVGLLSVAPIDIKVFVRIFKTYLNNHANPSSIGVSMMLQKEKSVEKTVSAAMKIKNKNERAKSIDSIVDNLLGDNRVNKAIQVVGSIKAMKELARPLTNLVKKLLNPKRKDIDSLIQNDQLDEAIQMADSINKVEDKDKIFQRVVSGLAVHKRINKALEVTEKIEDSDTRDFALSSMVSGLVARKEFSGAMKVALMIKDPGFREDAHSYIVRGLLEEEHFKDVIAFVEEIDDHLERTHAAKIILSSVRSNNDQEKVDEVCSRFELVSK